MNLVSVNYLGLNDAFPETKAIAPDCLIIVADHHATVQPHDFRDESYFKNKKRGPRLHC